MPPGVSSCGRHYDKSLVPKLEQQINPLLITHDRALHAVADICFDLLEERGIARAQVIALFLQMGEQAQGFDRGVVDSCSAADCTCSSPNEWESPDPSMSGQGLYAALCFASERLR